MKLDDISSIKSGYFSSTIKEGDVFYIQARDFDENKNIVQNLTPSLSYSKNIEKHFLNEGDILIVAKGASFQSYVYDGSYSPAVASTVFLVIRINDKHKILPKFLSWYLNLPLTQAELSLKGEGTAMPTLSKKTLQEFDTPVPAIQLQENIIKIEDLRRQEKFIQRMIDVQKEKKINQIISNALYK